MHEPTPTTTTAATAPAAPSAPLVFLGRDVYGRRIYYPATPPASAICRIAGRRSLDRDQLQLLADAGLPVLAGDPGRLDPAPILPATLPARSARADLLALLAAPDPAALGRSWTAEARAAAPAGDLGQLYAAALPVPLALPFPPTK
jgi:hypothetical protein